MKRLFEFFVYRDCNGKCLHRINLSCKPTQPGPRHAYFPTFGLLFNPHAGWWGCHYSPSSKRLCLNLIPFVTIWFAQEGGQLP